MMNVLAIDPGNTESAYVFMRESAGKIELGEFAKAENEIVLGIARRVGEQNPGLTVAIEMIASYGQAVGREVFDTCVFIGRLHEAMHALPVRYVYRREVKLNLCNSSRAKDTNVRQALIDRFARHDLARGRGTKKDPDFFYGVKAGVWAAIAVGVTYIDAVHEEAAQDSF